MSGPRAVARRLALVLCIGVAAFPVPWVGAATCGDGTIEAGEDCDDGNTAPGDCCSPTCAFEAADTVCRPVAGPCDVAETCPGTSDVCPADALASPVTPCRAAAGPCDLAELCSGAGPACPADVLRPADFACRPAAGDCDAAERCTGASASCPADAPAASGTPCAEDGVACTLDTCDDDGGCVHEPVDAACAAADACSAAACDPALGCVVEPVVDGTPCLDADPCTVGDRCAGGACAPGPVRCASIAGRATDVLVTCTADGAGRGACEARGLDAEGVAGAGAVTRTARRRMTAGKDVRLRLRVNRAGRAALRRNGRLAVAVEATVSRAGEGAVVRETVVLTRARAARGG